MKTPKSELSSLKALSRMDFQKPVRKIFKKSHKTPFTISLYIPNLILYFVLSEIEGQNRLLASLWVREFSLVADYHQCHEFPCLLQVLRFLFFKFNLPGTLQEEKPWGHD